MSVPTLNLVNGAKIPMVGLGTFLVTDEKLLEVALDSALEAGYRHIDTATVYQNEHIIGKVLKKWFSSGKLKRDDVFITTKIPRDGVHPDNVEEFINTSLKKLQLDYVDLYLIHFPMYVTKTGNKQEPQPTDLVGTWKKMEDQVYLRRTRAIGVSNFNKEQVSRILANSRIKPAALQVELHVYLQQPELVKYCQDNGLVVVSYSSLGNPGRTEKAIREGRSAKEDLLKDPIANKIAQKHERSVGQILLKFLLQRNIVVIPKSTTPSRIKENISLFDFTLDSSDISALQELDQGEDGRRTLFDFDKTHTEHPEYPFRRPH